MVFIFIYLDNRFKYIFQKNIYRYVILKLAKVSELIDFDLRQFVFLPDIIFEIIFLHNSFFNFIVHV